MYMTNIKSSVYRTLVLVSMVMSCTITVGQEPSRADIQNQFYAIDEFSPMDMGTNMIIYRDARYIGGMKALRRHLNENVVYPDNIRATDASGKVLIRCTIGSDGSVNSAEIIRSVHPSIDSAVITAVLSMPLWEPAIQYGLPIGTTVVIPYKTK